MIFLYAPVILLPLFAFNNSTIIAFPLSGFTTDWFVGLWHTPTLHTALGNSADCRRHHRRVQHPAGCLCRPGIVAVRVSGQDRHRRADHAAAGPARDHHRGGAAGHAEPAWACHCRSGPWLAGHVLICTPFAIAILSSAYRGLDRELGGSLVRSGRNPLGHLSPRDPAAGPAGGDFQPADHLHHLAGRIHHRLLPDRHRRHPAGLYLEPAALSLPSCHRSWRWGRSCWRCRSCC